MTPNDFIRTVADRSAQSPDVTWVGRNPFTQGLCFGFDNGGVVFTDDSAGYVSKMQIISPAGDAINGVAAIGTSSLAISTRSEVTLIQFKGPFDNMRAVFPGGAHGVVATQSGYFVAPLGPKGLLVVKPTNDDEQRMGLVGGAEGGLYFYRAAALHDEVGNETLVFANRKNGVGLSVFNGSESRHHVHTMGFEGIDVVDVCAVMPNSLSAIAITKTAELLWIQDTSKCDDPIVIKMTAIDGPVYKVLATPDHLFVLSSKGLYAWVNLIACARTGRFVSPDMMRLVLPIAAIDMAVIDNKVLLLVMGVNAITSIAIADIENQSNSHAVVQSEPDFTFSKQSDAGLFEMNPIWQTLEVEQEMACV